MPGTPMSFESRPMVQPASTADPSVGRPGHQRLGALKGRYGRSSAHDRRLAGGASHDRLGSATSSAQID